MNVGWCTHRFTTSVASEHQLSNKLERAPQPWRQVKNSVVNWAAVLSSACLQHQSREGQTVPDICSLQGHLHEKQPPQKHRSPLYQHFLRATLYTFWRKFPQRACGAGTMGLSLLTQRHLTSSHRPGDTASNNANGLLTASTHPRSHGCAEFAQYCLPPPMAKMATFLQNKFDFILYCLERCTSHKGWCY